MVEPGVAGRRLTAPAAATPGSPRDACQHGLEECVLLCGGRVLGRRQRDPHRQNAIRLEARVDALDGGKAFEAKARSGEQNHREGDFADHQCRAQPPVPGGAGTPGALPEPFVEGGAGGFQRRREPEDNSGQEREQQGVGQYLAVNGDAVHGEQRGRGDGYQEGQAPVRDEQAASPADKGHEYTLGEQLPDDAPVAGAQGDADGDFPAAGDGAGEHEISNVGARDEKQEPDGGGERQRSGADLPNQPFVQILHVHTPTVVGLRVLDGEPVRDGLQVSACRGGGNSRLQAADHIEEAVAALARERRAPAVSTGRIGEETAGRAASRRSPCGQRHRA